MEIDRADFALLNAVCEDEWAAYLLAGDAPVEAIMNKPSHGLSPSELSRHFFKLWSAGLIECSTADSGTRIDPDLENARRQFERTPRWPPAHDECLIYRLSKTGGDTWEHFAGPDWSKYLLSSVGERDNEWTLTGAEHHLVQRWRELGSSFDAGFPVPLAGTETWETMRPWQATYWKALPVGHRLTFQFETWDRRGSMPNAEEIEQVFKFQREVWGGWHEKFDAICEEHFERL